MKEKIFLRLYIHRKENDLIKYCESEKCLQSFKKERSSKRLKRRYSRDNIRVKIKRAFLNNLIIKLNNNNKTNRKKISFKIWSKIFKQCKEKS